MKKKYYLEIIYKLEVTKDGIKLSNELDKKMLYWAIQEGRIDSGHKKKEK